MRHLAISILLLCVTGTPRLWAQRQTRAREGAIVGFIVGATATVIVTHSGGSTAPCNRSANQDALSSGECIGLAVAGGLVGAGLGALIGSRIRVNAYALSTPLGPRRNGRMSLILAIGAPF
jgi:hypothetical protein